MKNQWISTTISFTLTDIIQVKPMQYCWHLSRNVNNTALENVHCTGCKRRIRKTFEVKIWKESLLVKEQRVPQQKALDLSFNLAPWKWAWHYHEAATPSCPKRSQKPFAPTYAFHGKEAWRPPDNAMPTFRMLN